MGGYSPAKVAAAYLGGIARAELEPRGITCTNLFVGSVDTKMADHVDGEKEPPSVIAKAGLKAMSRAEWSCRHRRHGRAVAGPPRARPDPLRARPGQGAVPGLPEHQALMTVLVPPPPQYVDPEFALLPDGERVLRLEDVIRARAAATPDATALITADGSVTFGELDRASNRFGQALLAAGVGRGDRVAWIGPNHARFLELLYGASKAGGVPTSVNTRLSADETTYVLKDADPSLVVLGPGFDHLEDLVTSVTRAQVITSTAYDGWLAAAEERDPGHARGPRDAALMLYSSGTTGRPKGVELPAEAFGRGLAGMHYLIGFDTTSVAHAPLPFFHISGIALALAANLDGAALLMQVQTSTEDLCHLMQEHRVSHTVLVPTVVADLLQLPGVRDLDWSALRYITYGAAPCPRRCCARRSRSSGATFLQSYGLTESTGGVTMLTAEDHRDVGATDRLRSVGRPMPGTPMKVVDPETLADVPLGTPGEIAVGGERVMLGYWRNERGHGRGGAARRLAAHRRRWLDRRGRLRVPARPDQGHGRLGRREHLPGRGRAGAHPAPRGRPGGRGRDAVRRAGASRRSPSSSARRTTRAPR